MVLSKDPPLRIAVVGAGLMGFWHADAARRLRARLVYVADPDLGRAKALAEHSPGAAWTSEPESILRLDRIDAVHICSPLSTHTHLARCAIDAGVHVLVEKPLAASLDETGMLLDAARRARVILCPVHQMSFQDGVQRAISALGGLGPISSIDFNICSAGGSKQPAAALDEIVSTILPHPLSLLRTVLPSANLEAQQWHVTHPGPGDLLISGEHAGAIFTMYISMKARPACFDMSLRCHRGTIRINLFHGFALIQRGRVSRAHKVAQPFADAVSTFGAASINLLRRGLRGERAYPGLRRLVELFYGAVRSQNPIPIPCEETKAVARACETIWKQMCPESRTTLFNAALTPTSLAAAPLSRHASQ